MMPTWRRREITSSRKPALGRIITRMRRRRTRTRKDTAWKSRKNDKIVKISENS